jgi:hypothetical protein
MEETKTYKLLFRRCVGIKESEFFNSKKVKKTGYECGFCSREWGIEEKNKNHDFIELENAYIQDQNETALKNGNTLFLKNL